MIALLSGILAVCFASALRGNTCQTATAMVLLVNWCLNTAFCALVDVPDPWIWFVCTDYLSGLAIYGLCESRFQRAIMLTYALQCIMHVAYGIVGPVAQTPYWDALYSVAWVQVALIGVWMLYDVAGHRAWARLRIPSGTARHP